jgi:cell division protein FtsN
MEKQRIFWVILSVSIFMVVLLIVGVFVVKQKPAAVSSETVSPLSDLGTRVFEFGQEKPSTQPLGASNEPEVLKFIIGEETPEKPAVETAAAPTRQAPMAAGIPELSQPQKTAPSASREPAAQTRPQAAAAPGKAVPQTAAPQKPAATRTVRTIEYWIQTGSYKSQTKAEDLAKLLSSKGLPGRVLSHSLEAETYFRVRIGPYTNKDEAGKFLSIVRQIQGLEASYISSVTGTRAVN